jgi:hypothetical protein
MFDKLYVLAKGGICVFSGCPQDLKSHLEENDLICNKIQVPIEVLLKHSSNGSKDNYAISLAEKASNEKFSILSRCEDETCLFPDGIQFRSKKFKLIDLWILFLRTMTYTYRFFWKLLLLFMFSYLIFGYYLTVFFRNDIGNPSGCISFEEDFNSTCNKSLAKIEEEALLSQNLSYTVIVISLVLFLQVIATTMTFTSEFKIIYNEHRNGLLLVLKVF